VRFRPLINEKLKEFEQELPEYSFAETALAIFKAVLKDKPINYANISTIEDEEIYPLMSKIIEREKDYEW
jgi:hypothetical protein